MKYYPQTFRKVIVAIADIFNNITYPTKVRNTGDASDLVVPIIYSDSERLIAFYKEYDSTRNKIDIQLPQLSFDIESVDPNFENKTNTNNRISSCDLSQYFNNPNSVDITFSVNVWTRQDHEDQIWMIMEQIIAKFDKIKTYPFTAVKFNDGSSIKYNIPIELNSIANNFTKFDVGKDDDMILKSTLTFTLKDVLMFGSIQDTSGTDDEGNPYTKLIESINISFENEFELKYSEIRIFKNSGDETIVEKT